MTAQASEYTYYSEDKDHDEDFYVIDESGKPNTPLMK